MTSPECDRKVVRVVDPRPNRQALEGDDEEVLYTTPANYGSTGECHNNNTSHNNNNMDKAKGMKNTTQGKAGRED